MLQQLERVSLYPPSGYTAVSHCGQEERVRMISGAAAEPPTGTFARRQINATPLYAVALENGFPGRIGWDTFGVLRVALVVLAQCDIACSASLEVAPSMDWVGDAQIAGGTLTEIIGTRVYVGVATIAGGCSLVIVGTRVLCGVIQIDGRITLRIVVAPSGVYISCYTGNGQPVVPGAHQGGSPFSKNYVF